MRTADKIQLDSQKFAVFSFSLQLWDGGLPRCRNLPKVTSLIVVLLIFDLTVNQTENSLPMKRRILIICTVFYVFVAFLSSRNPVCVHAQGTLKDWEDRCNQMVEKYIVSAGVKNPAVLNAIRQTPRHEFVPMDQKNRAYFDMALPIGYEQTISSPFIVAYMTECIDPQPGDKVLEIGTGSGYQAAVLSPLVESVYSIEIVPQLGRKAAQVLRKLKYNNVKTKVGDGFLGWEEYAPFDKIIVTCSPEKVPVPLVNQLREGGRIIIPLGERFRQTFYLARKINGKIEFEALRPTLFVPMSGEAERNRQALPDGSKPQLYNGDFEIGVKNKDLPDGWYYQRQLTWVKDSSAPRNNYYISLNNEMAGRQAGTMQGFAVDGRHVKRLKFTYFVQGQSIFAEAGTKNLPCLKVTFFDERRAELKTGASNYWKGSFAWRPERCYFDVPPQTRHAIVYLNLYGATGTVNLDAIELDFR